VKHNRLLAKELTDLLLSGDICGIDGLSLEFFLFFIQGLDKPCVFVLDRDYLETASIMLQADIGESVCCLFEPFVVKEGFENIYNKLSNISKQALSTGKKPKITLIEKGVFDKPVLSEDFGGDLVVGPKSVFDEVVDWLAGGGFNEVGAGQLRPGSFYINGGVVDVWPFNSQKSYRVSFLDVLCSVFEINPQTNQIKKTVKTTSFSPLASSTKMSPCDFFKNGFLVGVFSGQRISLRPFFGGKIKKIDVKVVDYQLFMEDFRGGVFRVLGFDCDVGFLFMGVCFIPPWFQQQDNIIPVKPNCVLDGTSSLLFGATYVHEDFGLCRLLGLEEYNNQERVCLEFLDGVVRLDIHYLAKLSFYSSESAVQLSYLNRPGRWKKQKQKAKKEAENYVKNIIEAYAFRDNSTSVVFDVKDPLINDFVNSFEHKDTPDQASCWEEVLFDLGRPEPMNRLVCGDVGFGKTEIAIRAAFVAILNNQQVVVMAPTTILASQLYHSFVRRLGLFGVRAGILSSLAQNKEKTLNSFLNQKIDILIGTSALLFKPKVLSLCSLFIVDEEHRFGVKDKELIFSINPNVNYLSLSATPIPRSLQLALNNIRTLSLIQSPPIERKPIICFVHHFDISVICTAILKEVGRGGQVFFVDNSVDNLKKIFVLLKSKLQNISFALIYSRLNKKTLTSNMSSFISGKTRVLLSTTIIESGIDIGQANTIIINNAHLFGLSQLYQLRGRVGRSHSQAFAWFLAPIKKHLKEGKERLKTIIQHTSLGSGYQIALSDLNLRGGGALFGYNQSGEGGVGFELYTKLINLVINNDKQQDCIVSGFGGSLLDVFSNEEQRGYFYKCVFSAKNVSDINQIKRDFIGLYKTIPKEFGLLLGGREVALVGAEKNIIKINKKGGWVFVVFHSKQKAGFVNYILLFVESFFNDKKLEYSFVKTENNFTFQYKSVGENDYILLLDFINKLSF